jgi:uncharacterized membrane protein
VQVKKVTAVWQDVRDSLWFIPTVLTLSAAVLAFITVQLDLRSILPQERPEMIWLYTGSADAARGVLTAIASGLITVTGVVFSVTIVALQLASSQFTPRVLRNFTADRANQVVLGVFIGTFTYALLVLRVVRGTEPAALEDGQAFMPHISITVALLLTIVSIGFLIFFINHLARSIQASVILDRVTDETLRTMDRLVPEHLGEPTDDDVEAVTPRAPGSRISAEKSGYVQGIDQDSVFELLSRDAYTIRLERGVGEFILPGSVLATVWPDTVSAEDRMAQDIRRAYILGVERTPYMDVERGVIELSDIALRALSPSVNDPTTAVLCVDRLAEVLLAFARREPPSRIRHHGEGGGVLIVPRTDFEQLASTALDQVRHFGVGDPRFARSLLDRLTELGRILPAGEARRVLARHVAMTLRDARRRIDDEADLRRVEAAAASALHALGGAGRVPRGRPSLQS